MKNETFKLDIRNVRKPQIGDSYIDFALAGDVIYNDTACEVAPDFLEFEDD